MKPFTWPPPTGPGKIEPYYGVPELNSAFSGCVLDRVPIPCDIFHNLLNNGGVRLEYLLPMEENVSPKLRKRGQSVPSARFVLKTVPEDIISHGVGVFPQALRNFVWAMKAGAGDWREESFAEQQDPAADPLKLPSKTLTAMEILLEAKRKNEAKERNFAAWLDFTSCMGRNETVKEVVKEYNRKWYELYAESWDLEGMLLEMGGHLVFDVATEYKA